MSMLIVQIVLEALTAHVELGTMAMALFAKVSQSYISTSSHSLNMDSPGIHI